MLIAGAPFALILVVAVFRACGQGLDGPRG